MLVIGHIGLTPQSSCQLEGFKAQGRICESALDLSEDALAVQQAGAFSLLVEAVPPEFGKIITKKLSIPVLSIGARVHCDGQLLIVSDLLGLFQTFTPIFLKRYANLSEIVREAFENYIREDRAAKFPGETHTYSMLPGKFERLSGRISENP
jgi:3-methyl-2-oxobutanoate hydroxymethyltransferase